MLLSVSGGLLYLGVLCQAALLQVKLHLLEGGAMTHGLKKIEHILNQLQQERAK